MDRKRIGLILILMLMFLPTMSPVNAQPGPMGDHEGPGEFGMDRPGPREMMEMRERMGKFPGKGPSPEKEKERKQRQAVQAIAEAHKELARIYEEQKKIDEAAAELKKILTLFDENPIEKKEKADRPQAAAFMASKKIIPVYHEISRLYLMNNRLDDAEKIMLEGIARFEKDDAQAASKMILSLSDIYRKNNKLEKAEELLKKVIEINQMSLKE